MAACQIWTLWLWGDDSDWFANLINLIFLESFIAMTHAKSPSCYWRLLMPILPYKSSLKSAIYIFESFGDLTTLEISKNSSLSRWMGHFIIYRTSSRDSRGEILKDGSVSVDSTLFSSPTLRMACKRRWSLSSEKWASGCYGEDSSDDKADCP